MHWSPFVGVNLLDHFLLLLLGLVAGWELILKSLEELELLHILSILELKVLGNGLSTLLVTL